MKHSKKHFVIASRQSPLAMIQTQTVQALLERKHPDLSFSILPITTEGDKKLERSLATVGGKGLFVKELELALQNGNADFAVHSTKDMPIVQPDDLEIASYLTRDDPRDAFVSNYHNSLEDLPSQAIVGTASLRRQCLVKSLRPDLVVKVLRGNVQTRLKKLDEDQYDAIILAAAGLHRQEMTSRINSYLASDIFTPACTQGILCIECRKNDEFLKPLLNSIHDPKSTFCAQAERAMNAYLQGGCQVPIGGFAQLSENVLELHGMVGKPDGSLILRANASADKTQAEKLGINVAKKLLQQGAGEILDEVYQNHD